MKKQIIVIILIAVLAMQSTEAGSSAGSPSSGGSSGTFPDTQSHNVHIGTGTPNLKCDACHGFPPKTPTIEKGEGPGHYSVCEQCHDSTAIIPGTATPTQPAVADTYTEPAVTSNLEQEVREMNERINQTEQRQSQQETRISWLESAVRFMNEWLKSVF